MARLDRERGAIAGLQAREAWLTGAVWRLDPALVFEADIEVEGSTYQILLRYPAAFPNCPPSVHPRVATGRWSGHQYGKAGELCLEYGPDNWHPDLTGADMLESAHRLLAAEHSSCEARSPEAVPSRHRTTVGQDLRREHYRFIATSHLHAALAAVPDAAPARISVVLLGHGATKVAAVTSVDLPDGTRWKDPSIPAQASTSHVWPGLAVRMPSSQPLPPVGSTTGLLAALSATGVDLQPGGTENLRPDFVLLIRAGSEPRLVWLVNVGEDLLVDFTPIPPVPSRPRVEAAYEILTERRVGIVGAGSVGSKIAASLARSGVVRFLLIDGDILLPDNLVRHDLDWLAVGMHKVDGLARRLSLVNPGVAVETRRAMLAGQEASSSVAAALERLAECDLVIDATADPAVFNVLAGLAADQGKPLVWMEVFEGGIGGIVARYRPGIDPSPQTMRARILGWCAERGAPWNREGVDYASLDDSGMPMVADDAEMSLIAAHAGRFALDTLLARAPSLFPHPVYLVGLRRGWIFGEPFETHPVDVGGPEQASDPSGGLAPDVARENRQFVVGLLEALHEAAASD